MWRPPKRVGAVGDGSPNNCSLSPAVTSTVSEATLLARWQQALREIEGSGSEAEAATGARDLLITVKEHTEFLLIEAGYVAGERQYAFLQR